jgi:hypothetical protein
MKTMRIATLAAVTAGVAVGLASPASADLVDGTYDMAVPGRDSVTFVFAPCGAGCKSTPYANRTLEFHQNGDVWTANDGPGNVINIDNNTLTWTESRSFGGSPVNITRQLVKTG